MSSVVVFCDQYGCSEMLHLKCTLEDAEAALEHQFGWTKDRDGNDICKKCTLVNLGIMDAMSGREPLQVDTMYLHGYEVGLHRKEQDGR